MISCIKDIDNSAEELIFSPNFAESLENYEFSPCVKLISLMNYKGVVNWPKFVNTVSLYYCDVNFPSHVQILITYGICLQSIIADRMIIFNYPANLADFSFPAQLKHLHIINYPLSINYLILPTNLETLLIN